MNPGVSLFQVDLRPFELEDVAPVKKCPDCGSHFLEFMGGEPLKRGKSWSSKTFSVGGSVQ